MTRVNNYINRNTLIFRSETKSSKYLKQNANIFSIIAVIIPCSKIRSMSAKAEILAKLQKEILLLQGYTPSADSGVGVDLGPINQAFPNSTFPTGSIHEFVLQQNEHLAATSGFVNGLLGKLMQHGGPCLWISTKRQLFPSSLKTFKVDPSRIIFIDVLRQKDILWATEQALHCEGLAAVVAEVNDINFIQSRRLQLAVEKSRVTGLMLRKDSGNLGNTACTARWRITSLPGKPDNRLPGLGRPRWAVELMKVRNGYPAIYQVEWSAGKYSPVPAATSPLILMKEKRKAV